MDGGLHEVVDHGVVDVARVGELKVAHVQSRPVIRVGVVYHVTIVEIGHCLRNVGLS